jgi:hypothetical protein
MHLWFRGILDGSVLVCSYSESAPFFRSSGDAESGLQRALECGIGLLRRHEWKTPRCVVKHPQGCVTNPRFLREQAPDKNCANSVSRARFENGKPAHQVLWIRIYNSCEVAIDDDFLDGPSQHTCDVPQVIEVETPLDHARIRCAGFACVLWI